MKKQLASLLGALSIATLFTACSEMDESNIHLRKFEVEGPVVTASSCEAKIATKSRRYTYGPYCTSPNKISYDFGTDTRCSIDETPVRANGEYGEYRIENRKMNCQEFSKLTAEGQKELQQARAWLNKPGEHYLLISEIPAP